MNRPVCPPPFLAPRVLDGIKLVVYVCIYSLPLCWCIHRCLANLDHLSFSQWFAYHMICTPFNHAGWVIAAGVQGCLYTCLSKGRKIDEGKATNECATRKWGDGYILNTSPRLAFFLFNYSSPEITEYTPYFHTRQASP